MTRACAVLVMFSIRSCWVTRDTSYLLPVSMLVGTRIDNGGPDSIAAPVFLRNTPLITDRVNR